jgi:hypothetical protein
MVGVHIQHWLLGLNQVRRSYGRLAAHDRVGDSKGATMVKAGLDEKLYPVAKLATIVDLLGAEGISRPDALSGTHVSRKPCRRPQRACH